MALALTQIYLEPTQKKALAERARQLGRKPSEAFRDAVDAYVAGVTVDDLKLLDEASKHAQRDITEMIKVLDAGARRAGKFFAEIEKIKKKAA
jgi:hypothetical protein